MYAVCVNFVLKSGMSKDFMPLMLENARVSKQQETGCHQFDVVIDSCDPNTVFLYELYADRAAFDAHLASKHFKVFDKAIRDLIADKIVQTWDTVYK
ncbi:MAG: putative quinol monooxygenase [Pseudomonadota bacterium]